MTISAEGGRAATRVYEGRDALAFGFKALQIYPRNNAFTTRDYSDAALKALPEDEAPRRQLVVADALLELNPPAAGQ